MDINTLLRELGLTNNEVKTYLALMELGSVPAGLLIKRLGMHRAAVYNLLDLLIDKGLVHYVIQANRKNFEAQPAKRLFELIGSKKNKLEAQENQLKKLLPELELRRELSKESQEGTVYKGKKGLKSVFEDILTCNTDFLVLGATGRFKEIFGAYYLHWQDRREKKRIKQRIIYSDTVRKHKREKTLKHAEIRYLRERQMPPSTTFIYNDKVALILWSEVPMAFVIRSSDVADSYRIFFDLLWKTGKK
ncbi:MAG: hypothetical protein KJ709_01900 [Nanoarchaeota archaeon]|nr:hypothetical protein [Nanoarchaeota archaeon]